MKNSKIIILILFVLVAALLFLANAKTPGISKRDQIDDPILHVDTMDDGYLCFPVRIMDRSTNEAMTFNPREDKPATISYKLTRDGNIRIRVTWRRHPELVLRTLLDWTHQQYGRHQVLWDGTDASANLVDNTKCFIDFKGDDAVHKQHQPQKCHELDLEILAPHAGSTIDKLSDIRLKLNGELAYGPENGYKLRTYIDYEPVSVISLGNETTEFSLPNIDLLPQGRHMITINIEDGHDHAGVAGISVEVKS